MVIFIILMKLIPTELEAALSHNVSNKSTELLQSVMKADVIRQS